MALLVKWGSCIKMSLFLPKQAPSSLPGTPMFPKFAECQGGERGVILILDFCQVVS
jgi:hypothetical protein